MKMKIKQKLISIRIKGNPGIQRNPRMKRLKMKIREVPESSRQTLCTFGQKRQVQIVINGQTKPSPASQRNEILNLTVEISVQESVLTPSHS